MSFSNFLAFSIILNQTLVTVFYIWIMHGWYSEKLKWGEFIYHPYLMLLAFGILGPISSSTYFLFERQIPVLSHSTAKYVHATLHFIATILGLVGILDMWKVHADKNLIHFMSVHSWIGIVVYSIWCLQFLMGAYAYLISSNVEFKKSFMPYHKAMGKFLTISAMWVVILGELSYKYRGNNEDKEELLWKVLSLFTVGLILSIHLSIYPHPNQDPKSPSYERVLTSESPGL